MIGPAEIDEMMMEYAERIRWTGAGESTEPSWPLFVREDHLDEADRHLIESHGSWVTSCFRTA